MSGVIGSVGKVFKRVAKTAKKILPAALAIGAVVFTAGAAMGMLPSWGTAISGTMAKLGITGTLGNVLTGAVTQAGYGAVLGGATAALTGKKIGNGMMMGAAAGAITGGAMGAAGMGTDPLSGLNKPSTAAMPEVTAPGSPAPVTSQPLSPSQAAQNVGGPLNAPASQSVTGFDPHAAANLQSDAATLPLTGGKPDTFTPASSGNGMFDKGGWLERNGTLVGTTAAGLGKGLIEMASAEDQGKALKARQDIYDRNYRTNGNGLLLGTPEAKPAAKPRFDPNAFAGEWDFDPAQGKIVWKASQPQGAPQ